MRKLLLPPVIVFACLMVTPMLHADEGMWLFTNPPTKQIKEKYNFELKPDWLDHVQKSSVRFNNGGSGSFVSADGLIMTNHHVGADSLEKKGGDNHDYLKEGFYAKTNAEELKCEDLELNVLMKIEDVTDKVKAAVTPDLSPEKAAAARRDVMARLKKEASDKTKLRCDVVTLYQGAQYHLYMFKKYTDVRIVFAPEQQIAFFGGDPDNFEYPRYDLDICLFRAYEDGKPAKIEHFLKWSKDGAKDNELVFVSGHPGSTSRLTTVAELEYLRDTDYPYYLQRLNRMEVMLMSYSARSVEKAKEAKETLLSVQNSRKARIGGVAGLLDPEFMTMKLNQEAKLKADAKDESFKDGSPWDRIAKATKVRKETLRRYTLLERRPAAFNTRLFGIARALVRGGDERPKPNGERLPEYEQSGLESLEFQLFSEAPIYDDFEILKLTDSLTFLATQLGADDPLVMKVLAGKAPAERANQLIKGTKLKDVAVRKELWKGGKAAISASKDPLIELARLVDEAARGVRKTVETQVDEPLQQAYAEIAKIKFREEGTSTYPDATFTLRLSYGVVKGYEENGKHIPFETKIGGIFERAKAADYKEPFDLPERWMKISKDPTASKLNMNTPFNFVCTADIIGGNSGSPVINKNAEVVGLIFDGNIQSLVLDFAYTEEQARAVSVHSQGIVECLRNVYHVDKVADELTGKSK